MSADSIDGASAKRGVDRNLAELGHITAPWRWDGEGAWVATCPQCHCNTYVTLNGSYFGATLGIHCLTLSALYRVRRPLTEW